MSRMSSIEELRSKSVIFKQFFASGGFCLALALVFISLGAIEVRAQNSCTSNTDCTRGQFCDLNNVCVDIAPPMECNNGTDCDAPLVCDGKMCVPPKVDPEGCDFCAFGEMCVDGTCVPDPEGCTSDVDCNDFNPCTQDTCDTSIGCNNDPVLDGSDCDDGNACSQTDACQNGQCTAGTTLVCDDGNACNGVEACDPSNGCQLGVELICDDSNICNGEESCDPSNGCQPGAVLLCDNGDACDGTETCDPIEGCQDGTALECDDLDACTGIETCDSSNGCQPGTPIEIVDDGFSCTEETCDSETGEIISTGNSTLCDEDDECRGVKICVPEGAEPGSDGCIPTEVPEVDAACNGGEGVCSEERMCVETTGTIKIVKMADPNDGTDFLFSCIDENGEACEEINIDGPGLFPLDDEEDQENSDETPGMQTFSGLPAGVYAFQESAPDTAWTLIDVMCVNEDNEEILVENLQPVIELEPFDEITCTFFNEVLCGNGMPDEGEECDPALDDPNFCSNECTLFDSDGDGVTNEFDLCPETPEGEVVDEQGCPIEEEMACDCDDPNAITEGFTFRNRTYFYGTFGDDIICGTSERDVILSFSGDDCIDTGAGRDLVFAGLGNDIIFSGDDNDRVFAGPGDDEADGGEGFDFIHGGFGVDLCFGERLRRCE